MFVALCAALFSMFSHFSWQHQNNRATDGKKNAQQQRNKKHIRKLGQFFMNEFDYLVRLMHAFCVIIFRCFRPLQMWWRAVDDKCVRYLKCSGCMLSHALVIFRHRPFYLVAVVFDKNIPHGFKWSFRVESHLYGDTVNTFFLKRRAFVSFALTIAFCRKQEQHHFCSSLIVCTTSASSVQTTSTS